MRMAREIFTVGHGRRPADELVACLREAEVKTLVDVRRFPASRRNPQFNQATLAETLAEAGIEYRHAVELGGRRSNVPGEEQFACLGAFAGYAASMGARQWQEALNHSPSRAPAWWAPRHGGRAPTAASSRSSSSPGDTTSST